MWADCALIIRHFSTIMDRLRISNVTIILTLGLALASVASAQQGETLGFEDALARYKECIERIPFRFHT